MGTLTLPVIVMWIEQWYGYEPAAVNVNAKVWLFDLLPESNRGAFMPLVSAVAVCTTASLKVQVTVPPSEILAAPGLKAKPCTATAASFCGARTGAAETGTASAAAAMAAGARTRSERGVMTFPFLDDARRYAHAAEADSARTAYWPFG